VAPFRRFRRLPLCGADRILWFGGGSPTCVTWVGSRHFIGCVGFLMSRIREERLLQGWAAAAAEEGRDAEGARGDRFPPRALRGGAEMEIEGLGGKIVSGGGDFRDRPGFTLLDGRGAEGAAGVKVTTWTSMRGRMPMAASRKPGVVPRPMRFLGTMRGGKSKPAVAAATPGHWAGAPSPSKLRRKDRQPTGGLSGAGPAPTAARTRFRRVIDGSNPDSAAHLMQSSPRGG